MASWRWTVKSVRAAALVARALLRLALLLSFALAYLASKGGVLSTTNRTTTSGSDHVMVSGNIGTQASDCGAVNGVCMNDRQTVFTLFVQIKVHLSAIMQQDEAQTRR